MLGKMDDYFIHQIVETIDHVGDGDTRFQDRLYFNVHGDPGDFTLGFGLGVFPNQAVMDGFICAVHRGKQYNLRVSRPVTNDRAEMHAGPLSLYILEPMKRWRLQLAPNDFGVHFDLEFEARTAPFEHLPIFRRVDGHVNWHQQHLQQSGLYSGWIDIGGTRVQAARIWGTRDRSWGVRGPLPGARVEEPSSPLPGAWLSAQFDEYAIQGWFGKDAAGRDTHVDGAISSTESEGHSSHFVRWDYRYGSDVAEADYALRLLFDTDDDSQEVLDIIKPIMWRDTEGGGYYAGFFGQKRRDVYIEGENWDLRDPEFLKRRGMMHGEVLCEFRHGSNRGFGILQSAMLRKFP